MYKNYCINIYDLFFLPAQPSSLSWSNSSSSFRSSCFRIEGRFTTSPHASRGPPCGLLSGPLCPRENLKKNRLMISSRAIKGLNNVYIPYFPDYKLLLYSHGFNPALDTLMQLINGFFWAEAFRGRSSRNCKTGTDGKVDAKTLVLSATFNNQFCVSCTHLHHGKHTKKCKRYSF